MPLTRRHLILTPATAAGLLAVLLLAACAAPEPPPHASLDIAVEGPTRCANHPVNDRYERNVRLQLALDQAVDWLRRRPEFADLTAPCLGWAPDEEMTRLLGERPREPPLERDAVYFCAGRTLILRERLADTLAEPPALSYLLHELVHHAQCRNQAATRQTRCERERQAYQLQGDFLRARAAERQDGAATMLLAQADRLRVSLEFYCPLPRT